MRKKTIALNEPGNATLTPYILECGGEFVYTQKRPAVLVIPGGAYLYCSAREAEPVALAYNAAGYHAFVLRYSVGTYFSWPKPLEEFAAAMRTIRLYAEEWGVDTAHIAAIGFSAGGHLAACGACLCEEKPFALLLGYPVTSQKLEKVLGLDIPVAERLVCGDMPPVFLFGSRTDTLVESADIAAYIAAMADAGVSFESHIYSYAEHGFSLGTFEMLGKDAHNRNSIRTADWFSASLSWLRECMEGKCKVLRGKERDGKFPFLSPQNSLGYILRSVCAKGLLEETLGAGTFGADDPTKTLFETVTSHGEDARMATALFKAVSEIADEGCPAAEAIKAAATGK